MVCAARYSATSTRGANGAHSDVDRAAEGRRVLDVSARVVAMPVREMSSIFIIVLKSCPNRENIVAVHCRATFFIFSVDRNAYFGERCTPKSISKLISIENYLCNFSISPRAGRSSLASVAYRG